MKDKKCEELAFPVLFAKGRYGYTTERKIHLTPTKYFNAGLLHLSGRFANNPEYLFFSQFIIEQKKVSDSINIALKKVHDQPVTASHRRSKLFPEWKEKISLMKRLMLSRMLRNVKC